MTGSRLQSLILHQPPHPQPFSLAGVEGSQSVLSAPATNLFSCSHLLEAGRGVQEDEDGNKEAMAQIQIELRWKEFMNPVQSD